MTQKVQAIQALEPGQVQRGAEIMKAALEARKVWNKIEKRREKIETKELLDRLRKNYSFEPCL